MNYKCRITISPSGVVAAHLSYPQKAPGSIPGLDIVFIIKT